MKITQVMQWSRNSKDKIAEASIHDTPEVVGKHPTIHQEFASGIHQERLELCNPLDSIELAHLYN